ncbi:MAG: hypothetical protein M1832_002223 [Thelocarpon impressellum]|nr:MAG: hypothetical protein M1832_002223 [Thelocarpon impressellum]
MPPRGPKRLSAAHHHHHGNARHENGLAQPGKRIERDRLLQLARERDGQPGVKVDGGVDGPGNGNGGVQAPPSAASSMAQATEGFDASTSEAAEAWGSTNGNGHGNGHGNGLYSPYPAGHDLPHAPSSSSPPLDPAEHPPPHRRIDVNASKNPAVHLDAGAMAFVSTILRACPLADTIAILIILLQIPPTLLTLVHVLFAALSLLPASASSLPSLADVFQGSGGTPSLATVAIADLAFLAVWLFLWAPAQNFASDFAQAVIAITLGGGHTGKTGGMQSGATCLAVIAMSQLMRQRGFKPSDLSFLSSTLLAPLRPASLISSTASAETSTSRTYTGWVRSALTVHILSQGVIRVVRRWLSRSNGGGVAPKKADADGANHEGRPGPDLPMPSPGHQPGEAPIAPPASPVKDAKMSSGKKKRKQSSQVRNQQPLWAALASTKVIVLKEYEQSHASAEAAGSNATDANNLGTAAFGAEDGGVWITEIGPTDLHFDTSIFEGAREAAADSLSKKPPANVTTGIDRSKPFFVRINKADWPSTRIRRGCGIIGSGAGPWTGEVFGLAPSSTYVCEFLSSDDDAVIYCTSVTTPPVSAVSAASSPAPSPVPQKSLRPSSPSSTLKKSIAAAESKIGEERARAKRTRKEHKSQLASLKREVDSFTSRLASSGGGDDRLRQRVLQISQHIRQAEDATGNILSHIEGLGAIPEEDARGWDQQKESWGSARQRHGDAHTEVREESKRADRHATGLRSDASSLQQKRERLQARLVKLNEQHERITEANVQGLDERERRAHESAARRKERAALEQGHFEQVNALYRTVKETQYASQQLWQQIHGIETACREQQSLQLLQQQTAAAAQSQVLLVAASPPTAEGAVAVSRKPNSSSGFVFPAYSNSPSSQQQGRQRSGSLLSMVSGPLDHTDASRPPPRPTPLQPHGPIEANADRRRSEGSRSGSGSASGMSGRSSASRSGSGSVRDPTSPVGDSEEV